MPTNYPLTPGELANNCWPADPQALYNEMFAKGYVQLTVQGNIIQETEPGPTDRDKIWWQIDGSGHIIGWWKYSGGLWRRPYDPTGVIYPNERRLWVGSEASLQTYDGGTVAAVTATTGPFWEVDHEFDGRSLMGPGTIPDVDPSKSLAVTEKYGTGEHTQTEDEMPAHVHTVNNGQICKGAADGNDSLTDEGTLRKPPDQGGGTLNFSTDSTGGGSSMNWVHPVYGCFVIKRTIRMWRTP